jgi:nicotinamide-nucleotide amidase
VTARVRAAVLVTGSEILLGRITDLNSGFLARALEAHGVRVERFLAVDDAQESLESGLRTLLAGGVDLVVTSGGLGPTHDDRTVAAVAAVTGRPLELSGPTLARIDEIVAEFARARGVDVADFAEGNRKQALVPAGADVLEPIGTAPGVVVAHGEQRIVVLPGPPVELARMWANAEGHPLVAPLLARGRQPRRVLRLYGAPESTIADAFADLGGDAGGTETTICATRGEIEVVIRYDEGATDAATRLADGLRERFGSRLYAEGETRLEELVLELLRGRGLTLATAESCTAGLVASRLASVAGASDVLVGGVVAYANELKHDLLGVSEEILARHGAVSPECARAMAEGARARTGADVAVSVTGVAGPGGGTPEKPVGLVYLHVSAPGSERGAERRFPGPRENVRDWSATAALHLVRVVVGTASETAAGAPPLRPAPGL